MCLVDGCSFRRMLRTPTTVLNCPQLSTILSHPESVVNFWVDVPFCSWDASRVRCCQVRWRHAVDVSTLYLICVM